AGGGVGAGAKVEYENLGIFLHSNRYKPQPGEKRTINRGFPYPKGPLPEVHWLPLTGGVPKSLNVNTLGAPLNSISHVFKPNGLYWYRHPNRANVYVSVPAPPNKIISWTEVEPVGELMLSK